MHKLTNIGKSSELEKNKLIKLLKDKILDT